MSLHVRGYTFHPVPSNVTPIDFINLLFFTDIWHEIQNKHEVLRSQNFFLFSTPIYFFSLFQQHYVITPAWEKRISIQPSPNSTTSFWKNLVVGSSTIQRSPFILQVRNAIHCLNWKILILFDTFGIFPTAPGTTIIQTCHHVFQGIFYMPL